MAFRRRVRRLFLIACAAMGLVWLRVVELQTVERDHWVAEARRFRLRQVLREAPRGRIRDRRGRVLARDEPVFQLAVVAYDWVRRQRVRCSACGAVHTHHPEHRPPRRCACRSPDATLEPLPLQDYAALEDLLDLERGTIARAALERVEEVKALIQGYEHRLEAEGMPTFLLDDAVRLRRDDLLQRPSVIVPRLPPEAVALVELDEDGTWHGFRIQSELRRTHPHPDLAPQMLGYVSLVRDAEELDRLRAAHPGRVTAETRVGRSGLEAAHDSHLLGRLGWEQQERGDDGRFVPTGVEQVPVPGDDLHLAVTLEACRAAEDVLEEHGVRHGRAAGYFPGAHPSGAFVAMEAETGAIVAWGEMPRFSLEDIDDLFDETDVEATWDETQGLWVPGAALDEDEPYEAWVARLSKPAPLQLSRVMRVAVEPGSTMKPFIGLATLSSGVPSPWMAPGSFSCLARRGMSPGCHDHRDVGFRGAIEVSCNRYWALLLRDTPGWPVYRRHVPAVLEALGLGQLTGVDVQGERPGVFLQDWADFTVAAPLEAAVAAVADEARARGVTVRLDLRGRARSRLAGRDPQRLLDLVETWLRWGIGAATPRADESARPGEVVLRAGLLDAEERWVDLRLDLLVLPGPDGADAIDPRRGHGDLDALGRATAALGGEVAPYAPEPGVKALTTTLRYHEPIGRAPGEPPIVLPDDGRNVAIGQGPVNVTPLQMVRAVSVLANGGRLVTPHVAERSGSRALVPPTQPLPFDPAHLEAVREGMRDVVEGGGGTARRVGFGAVPARVYGKTGTAQIGRWWKPADPDHADVWHHWFVGWAEAPGLPTLAFACVLHARTEGAASMTAAEACRDFLVWWFTEGPDVRLR